MGISNSNNGEKHQENLIKSDFNKYKKDIIDKIKEIIEDAFKDLTKETELRKNETKGKIIEKFKKYLKSLESELSDNKIPKSNDIRKEEIIEPFSSYDIENEYKKLTNEIKNKSRSYDDKREVPENESTSIFCKNIGIISRLAYNKSNLILKILHEKYKKKEEKIKLKLEEDFLRNDFSCWIKLKEKKESNFYKEYFNNYDDLSKNIDLPSNTEETEYLNKTYEKLTILYIHCMLSFPIINIYFKLEKFKIKNNDFQPNIMIDWNNKGLNRKVNFIFLPCLISMDAFLDNGQFYVFTYKVEKNEETSHFKNLDLDSLLTNEEFNIEKFIVLKTKKKDGEVLVETDYNFDDNLNLTYLFKFKNLKDKSEFQQVKKTNKCKIPSGCNFEECQLLCNNTRIGNSIKNEK